MDSPVWIHHFASFVWCFGERVRDGRGVSNQFPRGLIGFYLPPSHPHPPCTTNKAGKTFEVLLYSHSAFWDILRMPSLRMLLSVIRRIRVCALTAALSCNWIAPSILHLSRPRGGLVCRGLRSCRGFCTWLPWYAFDEKRKKVRYLIPWTS